MTPVRERKRFTWPFYFLMLTVFLSNITNANHVIFFAPKAGRTKSKYDHSRAQCIGRCARYGQTKQVYVYDFLALHTHEVNLYQARQRKTLVQLEDGGWAMRKRETLDQKQLAQQWRAYRLSNRRTLRTLRLQKQKPREIRSDRYHMIRNERRRRAKFGMGS